MPVLFFTGSLRGRRIHRVNRGGSVSAPKEQKHEKRADGRRMERGKQSVLEK